MLESPFQRVFASDGLTNSKEFPPANVIFCRYPYEDPSLARTPSTLTLWPIAFAKSLLLTPTLLNHEGGLLSKTQDCILPSSLFTSIATTMWGLIQSIFVSVPVSAKRLDISNIAEGE